MNCTYCQQTKPVNGWPEGSWWKHEQACPENPDNMADRVYTFSCGHDEARKPFSNDPDGSEIAAFLAVRECSDCFIAQYRAAQATMSTEQRAERSYELRAAFGTGVRVVNVITGEVSNT